MRARYLTAATLLHLVILAGLAFLVPAVWVHARPKVLPIRIAASEPVVVEEERVDPPAERPSEQAPAPPVEEESIIPEEPDEPKTALVEPAPVEPNRLRPIPELLVRVKPIVVEPPVEQKELETEVVREQRLEPRVPQDYVQNLLLDRRNKPPKYPVLARKRGIEGDFVVGVTVGTDGRAKRVRVIERAGATTAHKKMERAALKALERWHYTAVTFEGKAIEIEVRVPVEFRLK